MRETDACVPMSNDVSVEKKKTCENVVFIIRHDNNSDLRVSGPPMQNKFYT